MKPDRNKDTSKRFDEKNEKRNVPVYTGQFRVVKTQPLLEFLLENIKKQSRNNIKGMLKNRCVLVDGVATTRFDYMLTPKQTVQISKSPVLKQSGRSEEKLDIIYEDEEFIVINKPSGLLSVATDKENSKTAYRMLTEYVRKSDPKNQVFVVHRIDKETSGVLMIAKNAEIRDLLQDDWNKLVTLREYIAIVDGNFNEKQGTIKSWLTETSTHIMYSSKGKNQGKEAITHYQVIKENRKYSLLRIKIDSGRKNQIRVHMNDAGHPIIGDDKYGSPTNPLKRLGLHASTLELTHPVTHKKLRFEAKTPAAFSRLFAQKSQHNG